jgi:hypothetical protein
MKLGALKPGTVVPCEPLKVVSSTCGHCGQEFDAGRWHICSPLPLIRDLQKRVEQLERLVSDMVAW